MNKAKHRIHWVFCFKDTFKTGLWIPIISFIYRTTPNPQINKFPNQQINKSTDQQINKSTD